MGFFSDEKQLNIEIEVTVQYPYNGQSYIQKNTLGFNGYASFASVYANSSGIGILCYSANYNHLHGTSSWTTLESVDGGEFQTINNGSQYQGIVNGFFQNIANRSFRDFNETSYDNGSGYKPFTSIFPNLEEKWTATFGNSGIYTCGCYTSGGVLTKYTEFTDNNRNKYGYEYKITKLEGDCPVYADYSAGKVFGFYEIPFEQVSTLTRVDYNGLAFSPNNLVIDLPNIARSNALMYLLSDEEKYSSLTIDSELSSKAEVHYKVNFDGTKNPTIYVNWDCVEGVDLYGNKKFPDFFDANSVKLAVSYEEHTAVVEIGEYNILDNSTKTFTYGELLKYADSSAFDTWWNNLKTGLGIGSIFLYFTSTYLNGEVFHVEIKQSFSDISDISYTATSEPNNFPSLEITLNEKNNDDDDHTSDDGSGGDSGESSGGSSGSGVNPHSLLTTTYIVTPNRLKQLGGILWGTGFLGNIKLVNNNPIENIVSVKMFPFTLPATTDTEIVLGNVAMGVNGSILDNNYSYEHTIGSVSIPKHYNSFMDYAPYTRLLLYLPFAGVKELDNSLYMGRTLTIKYIIDVVLGSCIIMLYADNILIEELGTQVGVDIPVTASNRASVEMGILTNSLTTAFAVGSAGSVVGAVAGGIGGALATAGHSKYTSTTQGSPSSACGMYAYKNPILIIDRPIYKEIGGFAHTRGKMCLLNKTIKELKGFTIMDKNIELSSLPCTSQEKDEIRNILSSGFFV